MLQLDHLAFWNSWHLKDDRLACVQNTRFQPFLSHCFFYFGGFSPDFLQQKVYRLKSCNLCVGGGLQQSSLKAPEGFNSHGCAAIIYSTCKEAKRARRRQDTGVGARQEWIKIFALTTTSCVPLVKFLSLSEHIPSSYKLLIIIPVPCEDEMR